VLIHSASSPPASNVRISCARCVLCRLNPSDGRRTEETQCTSTQFCLQRGLRLLQQLQVQTHWPADSTPDSLTPAHCPIANERHTLVEVLPYSSHFFESLEIFWCPRTELQKLKCAICCGQTSNIFKIRDLQSYSVKMLRPPKFEFVKSAHLWNHSFQHSCFQNLKSLREFVLLKFTPLMVSTNLPTCNSGNRAPRNQPPN
jgi:hypothetical protein